MSPILIFRTRSGNSATRFLTNLLSGVLLLGLGACATPQVEDPDKVAARDDLVRIFSRLGAGFGKDDNADAWVRKWVSPMRILLVNDRSPEDADMVKQVLDKLEPLTGIPYEYPAFSGSENLVVRFVKRDELKGEIDKRTGHEKLSRKLPQGTICFALPRGRNNIGFADIFVVIDSGRKLRDICIMHEMMHAFGLIGHHQAFEPSILYHKSIKKQDFSINDRILLRTLYDPAITPGMPHARAVEIGKKLIAGFHRDLSKNLPLEDVLFQPLQW